MSTIISSVGQYFKHISWFFSFFLMKWCCTSICLMRMMCRTLCKCYASLIIAHDGCWFFLHISHNCQKLHKPNRFLCAMVSGHVLRLRHRHAMVVVGFSLSLSLSNSCFEGFKALHTTKIFYGLPVKESKYIILGRNTGNIPECHVSRRRSCFYWVPLVRTMHSTSFWKTMMTE